MAMQPTAVTAKAIIIIIIDVARATVVMVIMTAVIRAVIAVNTAAIFSRAAAIP
jgi:hypothetical protein